VRIILEEDHEFPATERQFKRKIKEWKLDKNVKDEEMRIILQHKRARSRLYGKDSIYYVRGRLVDYRKLQRFVQRKGKPKPSQLITKDQPPSLPQDIICQTPIDESPPPSYMKIDVQGSISARRTSEVGGEISEDHRMPRLSSSPAPTDQNAIIEIDHEYLNTFWEPWWPGYNPGKDISDFTVLKLPVPVSKPVRLEPQFNSSHAHSLMDSRAGFTPNTSTDGIESMDRKHNHFTKGRAIRSAHSIQETEIPILRGGNRALL